MKRTIALTTGLLVLAHSVLGCCAVEAEHRGERDGASFRVAAVENASRIEPAEGDRPGHEHECCHLSCQWVAPSGVDRVDVPQRDFVAGAAPAFQIASCVASAETTTRPEVARDAAPPVRRHLQFGVLLV
jgi:hypothetical protein